MVIHVIHKNIVTENKIKDIEIAFKDLNLGHTIMINISMPY